MTLAGFVTGGRYPADRTRRGVVAAVTTCSLLLAAPAASQSAELALKARIESMRATGVLQLNGSTLPGSDLVAALYERRGFTLLWDVAERRAVLRAALMQMRDDGLDPTIYHLAALTASDASATADRAAYDDILHTYVLLLAAQHLRYGRVDDATLKPRRHIEAAPTGENSVTAAERLLALEPGAALASVRPRHFVYTGLADALRRMRAIQHSGGWAHVPPVRLERGDSDTAVAQLRRRLRAEGDLAADADTTSPQFDDGVESAVRSFQHRHALNTDGIVGPATHRELAVPIATRIDQVRINLERARWVVHDLPDTFITVNIAGALVYFIRSGDVVFESRAVVGRTVTRTPVFGATLRYIDLNPTWTVPPGIVQEILNSVRRDPSYLSRQRIRIIDAAGRTVPAHTIDFRRYSGRSFPYTFRQEPGPLNPLGQLKLVFPNRHNVYLHDTPARELFGREQRTFSHGCIRVQDPVHLAHLVLADSSWSMAALHAAIATGQTRTIHLRTPVPVLVLYWTAAADLHGELHFYRDVYGRDAALLRAISAH
jgi:L,D-transpeptidase YcbB